MLRLFKDYLSPLYSYLEHFHINLAAVLFSFRLRNSSLNGIPCAFFPHTQQNPVIWHHTSPTESSFTWKCRRNEIFDKILQHVLSHTLLHSCDCSFEENNDTLLFSRLLDVILDQAMKFTVLISCTYRLYVCWNNKYEVFITFNWKSLFNTIPWVGLPSKLHLVLNNFYFSEKKGNKCFTK